MKEREPKRRECQSAGQILVLFAVGLVALLAGVAFVIDLGNAMSQKRVTQNAVDAAAEAGTVVIAQRLTGGAVPTTGGTCPSSTGDAWDLAVCRAVYGSASANSVDLTNVQYADYTGASLGAVGGGSVPTGAQGVRTEGRREFGTYFARAIGIDQLGASAQATAMTGIATSVCPPGSPCGVLPITVPTTVDLCNGPGKLEVGTGDWPYLGDAQTSDANMAIVPICKNQEETIGGGSAGSVGWLDLSTSLGAVTEGSCGGLVDQITDPCVVSLTFPTWIQTIAGGVGTNGPSVQTALNNAQGLVQIPLFDATCKVQPSGTSKGDCPPGQEGVGINTWYHIPSFANFKLDAAYLAGNDRQRCNELPGSPFIGGNNSDGCLKGWWVYALVAPGSIQLGPVTPGTTAPLGVQLIR